MGLGFGLRLLEFLSIAFVVGVAVFGDGITVALKGISGPHQANPIEW